MNDCLIVGSGFGGSIPALLLARAGLRVTLLERGPWRDTLPMRSAGIAGLAPLPGGRRFPTHILHRLHHRNLPGNGLKLHRHGLLELFIGNGIKVLCSSGVGGGSHVYGALHALPLRDDYWDGIGAEIDSARMKPHYDAVLAIFGSRKPTLADGITLPPMPWEVASQDFIDVPENRKPWWGYRFPATPGSPGIIEADGYKYREAVFSEEGVFGSRHGGKITLDAACLLPALKAGLQVLACHEAITVEKTRAGDFVVAARGGDGRITSHRSKRVIVAAGTLNTVSLLLKSRAAGGIRGMAQLGQGFGTNGDLTAKWPVNTPGADYPSAGIYKRLFQHKADAAGPILMQAGMQGLDSVPLPRLVRLRIARQLTLAAMGIDNANGSITLDNGRIGIEYDARRNEVYGRIKQLFREIERQSGVEVKGYDGTPFTPHPLGGARAGHDKEVSVVNALGEVHDVSGLFVTDASVFPRALGAPPSLSIAAWAHHVATSLVRAG